MRLLAYSRVWLKLNVFKESDLEKSKFLEFRRNSNRKGFTVSI